MSLLKQIKKDQLMARKSTPVDKPKVKLLTTLLGELESDSVGKANGAVEVTDDIVIAKVKKFTKSLLELAAVCTAGTAKQEAAMQEIEILADYLPKQLGEDELTVILTQSGATNMGEAMRYLKSNFAGVYDGKLASKVAKSLF